MVYFLSTYIFNYFSVASNAEQIGYMMTPKVFWSCGPIMVISWAYFSYMEYLQFKANF